MNATIIHALIERANSFPKRIAFVEVDRQLNVTRRLTYNELLCHTACGAIYLQSIAQRGDRILIFFEPGIQPLIAFLSTLAAGMIAVPAAPAVLLPATAVATEKQNAIASRRLAMLQNLVQDCEPRVVFSSPVCSSVVAEMFSEFHHDVSLFDFDCLASLERKSQAPLSGEGASGFSSPPPSPEEIAFLQYTSGSTALPKGVAITHANLVHNQTGITRFVGSESGATIVSWLPMFHDMGLVGDAMNALWSGGTCIKLNPADFLRRPRLWMEAVARFEGTITGGPNFAFQLATMRGVPDDNQLDLSSLRACYCGSEPVRRETLESFANAFARYGLRQEALLPCYGLAESTLIITGCKPTNAVFRTAIASEHPTASAFLQVNRTDVVSCGYEACEDTRLAIQDLETREDVPEGTIGEICVTSRSVSPGYWVQLKGTEPLRFADEKRTLRTGDLGFLQEGQLYVCGRIKNTLIVRGQKFIAEDLEGALERDFTYLKRVKAAVFSTFLKDREIIVVALECVASNPDLSEANMVAKVRQTLSELCGLVPDYVGIVRPSTLPRTTSGKLQRHLCAELWRRNLIDVASV
jgi:acyl-CoA synthetase (AMP-forming)/AMP-acid ligase II